MFHPFPKVSGDQLPPGRNSAPTLYHCILGVGLPVMMAVNVAGWPGSTHRSSVGTWMEGGAKQEMKALSDHTKFDYSHTLMFKRKEYHL